MEQIKRKYGEKSSEIRDIILEAKCIAEKISREGSQLFSNGEIDGEDLHKILLAVANLFEYLNTKYVEDKKLNEEVFIMTKTLYDPAVEQKGIEKGENQKALKVAENLLKLGMTEETVAKAAEISLEKVREVKKRLN